MSRGRSTVFNGQTYLVTGNAVPWEPGDDWDHYRDVNGRPTLWNRVLLPDPNPFPRLRLFRRVKP